MPVLLKILQLRFRFTILSLLSFLISFSQPFREKKEIRFPENEKYFSLNLISAAEPQFALGPSFGIRFTERSEFFTEAAYISRSPFYDNVRFEKLNGTRFILQYRYHFLQQWKPLFPFLGFRRNLRSRHQPFIGIEWRMKPLSFSSTGTFINEATNDTLRSYAYSARSFTYGAALIFGETLNLSSDEKWKLEITGGIGGKQRSVTLKTVPSGYFPYYLPAREWVSIPPPQVESGTVIFPFAIRLRYVID